MNSDEETLNTGLNTGVMDNSDFYSMEEDIIHIPTDFQQSIKDAGK